MAVKYIKKGYIRLFLADGYALDVPEKEYKHKKSRVVKAHNKHCIEEDVMYEENIDGKLMPIIKKEKKIPKENRKAYADEVRSIFLNKGIDYKNG